MDPIPCTRTQKIFFEMKRLQNTAAPVAAIHTIGSNSKYTFMSNSSANVVNWVVNDFLASDTPRHQRNVGNYTPASTESISLTRPYTPKQRLKNERDNAIRSLPSKAGKFLDHDVAPLTSEDMTGLLKFDNLPTRLDKSMRCLYGLMTTYYMIVARPILFYYEVLRKPAQTSDKVSAAAENRATDVVEEVQARLGAHWVVSPLSRKRLLQFWALFERHMNHRGMTSRNCMSEFRWAAFREDMGATRDSAAGRNMALALNVILADKLFPRQGFPRAIYRALSRIISSDIFDVGVSLCRLRLDGKILVWLVHALDNVRWGLLSAKINPLQHSEEIASGVHKCGSDDIHLVTSPSKTVIVAIGSVRGEEYAATERKADLECARDYCIWINLLRFGLSLSHPYDCLHAVYLDDAHLGPQRDDKNTQLRHSRNHAPEPISRSPPPDGSPALTNDIENCIIPDGPQIQCPGKFADYNMMELNPCECLRTPLTGRAIDGAPSQISDSDARNGKRLWERAIREMSESYYNSPTYVVQEVQWPRDTSGIVDADGDDELRMPPNNTSACHRVAVERVLVPIVLHLSQEVHRRMKKSVSGDCGRNDQTEVAASPMVVLTDSKVAVATSCRIADESIDLTDVSRSIAKIVQAGGDVTIACLPLKLYTTRTIVVAIPAYAGQLCRAFTFARNLLKMGDTLVLLHATRPMKCDHRARGTSHLVGDGGHTSSPREREVVKLYKKQGYYVQVIEVDDEEGSLGTTLVNEASNYAADLLVCDSGTHMYNFDRSDCDSLSCIDTGAGSIESKDTAECTSGTNADSALSAKDHSCVVLSALEARISVVVLK